MGQAELYGYHPEGSNPCVNIRRYRRRGRERFLSPDELCRLSTRLADNEESDPLVVAAIRLLILTGCPKSEILDLEWRDYREGRLYLRDSKTGCEPAAAKAAAPVDMMDKTLRACPRLHRCNNNRTVTDSGSEDP